MIKRTENRGTENGRIENGLRENRHQRIYGRMEGELKGRMDGEWTNGQMDGEWMKNVWMDGE